MSRSVALAIRNMPSTIAMSSAKNWPIRSDGKSWPCAAITTVSAPAARKSHLKKIANESFAIMPLKSVCGVGRLDGEEPRRHGEHGERAGGEERDPRRAPPDQEVEHEQDERPERERHLRPEPERGAQVLVDEREEGFHRSRSGPTAAGCSG